MRMHQHSPAEPLRLATLLIVHSSREQAEALVAALSDEPYEVVVVGSSEQAIQVATSRTIDVVIGDLELAGSSESELFGQLRLRMPGIIRILVGSNEAFRLAQRAARFGWAHHYLPATLGYGDLALVLYNTLVQRSFLPPESEGILPLPPLPNSLPPSNRSPSTR